jgi:hypothetical protein
MFAGARNIRVPGSAAFFRIPEKKRAAHRLVVEKLGIER